MGRQNGTHPFSKAITNSDTGFVALIHATQRMTVDVFGAIADDASNLPASSFAFKAVKRTGGASGNDVVVDAYTAANAAEGGPSGNSKLSGGIVTNTASDLAGGEALRAYCEVSLDRGDIFGVNVTAAVGSGKTAVLFCNATMNGAGLVEANDVDSN